MINVCTVSDINYLNKGLTLYESLKKHTDDIVLHYLCIGDDCYQKLKKYESDSLKVYNVSVFLEIDDKLSELKQTDYWYFCMSLASYFSNKLLKSDIDSITYIDSDIFFHKSFKMVIDDINKKDVGIFRHRQFPLSAKRAEGVYNVGVSYFKNSELGRKVSDWWVDAVLNKRYPEYATCGDQKYLEYFTTITGSENIYIDGNIGHGAPWHWQTFQFMGNGKIKYGNQVQDLVFTHFSQFDDKGETYIPSTMHHIYTPLSAYQENNDLKTIYDEYHNEMKLIEKKYI